MNTFTNFDLAAQCKSSGHYFIVQRFNENVRVAPIGGVDKPALMPLAEYHRRFEGMSSLPDLFQWGFVVFEDNLPVRVLLGNETWNGFPVPYFDQAGAQLVAKHYLESTHQIERGEGGWYLYDSYWKEEGRQFSPDLSLSTAVGEVIANPLFSGWVWEKLSDVDALSSFYLAEVAKTVPKSVRVLLDEQNAESNREQDALIDYLGVTGADELMHEAYARTFPDADRVNTYVCGKAFVLARNTDYSSAPAF